MVLNVFIFSLEWERLTLFLFWYSGLVTNLKVYICYVEAVELNGKEQKRCTVLNHALSKCTRLPGYLTLCLDACIYHTRSDDLSLLDLTLLLTWTRLVSDVFIGDGFYIWPLHCITLTYTCDKVIYWIYLFEFYKIKQSKKKVATAKHFSPSPSVNLLYVKKILKLSAAK